MPPNSKRGPVTGITSRKRNNAIITSCAYANVVIKSEEAELRELEQYFKALSDVNRLRIVNLLLHGELCVCDIQYVLDSPQPNVSRHLAYLKNSGLVLDRRDGLRIFYRLAEAEAKHGGRKRLFEFLQHVYKNDPELQEDIGRLRAAIKEGACTVSEWKPYSAIGTVRRLQSVRG